jgi:integrase
MQTISEKIVAALPVPPKGNKLHYFSQAALQGKKAPSGFAVRVTSAGTKSFVWFHRVNGKGYLETIGRWDENEGGGSLTVLAAIKAAKARAEAVALRVDGKGKIVDPRPERTRLKAEKAKPKSGNISGLLDQFIAEKREEGDLRSIDQIEATFDRLVKPEIGHIGIYDVQRSDIVGMLKKIAKQNGPVMSDRVLAYVRSVFNWYAPNDDKFNSPIVKRMARTKPNERKRKRVLADDEIKDVWAALDEIDEAECYPAFVKTLLLTATRRNESANMSTTELDGELWTIPAARYKTKLDHVVPLSAAAVELIRTQAPEKPTKNAHFVFSTTGGEKPFSGFSKAKTALDDKITEIREREGRTPMENWTLHDLRRTARSLMSRAKVPTDHAERALGHVMGGVRETYDRHEYLDEKRAAFEALATLVSIILNPTTNVEELASRPEKAA